jgi:hypothetical protein
MSSPSKAARGASDSFAALIITLLVPMFLWSCEGDVALSRAAAAETLNAYCAADDLSLIRAAKVLAFDLATLSSLGRSMFDEISASLALRLRSGATSLDRAAERNRVALEQDRRNAAQAAEQTRADVAASVQAAQHPVPRAPTTEPATPQPQAPAVGAPVAAPQRQAAPAAAMAEMAADMIAALNGSPPPGRAGNRTQSATALSSGTALPPYLAASSVTAAPAGGGSPPSS